MEPNEMSVEQTVAELKKQQANAAAKDQEKYLDVIARLEPLAEIEKKNPKTLDDAVKAQASCCFMSLSYCCGTPKSRFNIGKQCLFRDSVIKALGLTQEQFEEFKKRSDDLLIEFLKEKGFQ